jgi:opacity protein-like surface antigen
MKKLFMAALLVAAIGSTAFAADVTKVNIKVKNNFEAQFAEATNVSWSTGGKFTRASFELNDQKIEAFYGSDGEAIGYSRQIGLKQLPQNAVKKINKLYADYKVAEVIEFTQEGDKNYYVSLENGNNKQILEVSIFGDVSKYTGTKY